MDEIMKTVDINRRLLFWNVF